MGKKGQAAMEFLMTYGWALLVVLIVISALAYFGVLSPGNLVSERCTFETGLGCNDFAVGSNGVSVVVTNMRGSGMTITNIAFTSDALVGDCDADVDAFLGQGESATFYADDVSCSGVNTGRDKNRYDVSLTYKLPGSTLEHRSLGELVATQQGVVSLDGGGGYGGGSSSLVMQLLLDNPEDIGADSSSNGNDGTFFGETFKDGTIAGSPSLVTGKHGNALQFDGSNDFVSIPVGMSFTDEVAFSAWVYADVIDGNARGIWSYDSASKDMFFMATLGGSPSGNIQFTTHDGVAYRRAYGSITPGTWHHIAGVAKENEYIRLYIDGVLTGEAPIGAFADISWTDRNEIGAYSANPSRFFDGMIDSARIYDVALDGQQIQADMASAYPEERTIASYPFESIDGGSVFDTHHVLSGNEGGALSFDGTDDYLEPADFTYFPSEGNFSIAVWFNRAASNEGGAILAGESSASGGNPVWSLGFLPSSPSNLRFRHYDSDEASATLDQVAGSIGAGTWTHAAITYDGTSFRLYKNGAQLDSDVRTVPNSMDELFFGKTNSAGGGNNWGHFRGTVDDVRIWSRHLSSAEIAVLAGQ